MVSRIPGISDDLSMPSSGAGGVASLIDLSVSIPAAFMNLSSIHGYVNISLNPHLKARYSLSFLARSALT